MNLSATELGREYNLTAQEMNWALLKKGFLEGEPGNYSLTEKGLEYGIEKWHHRGCGGYSWYNREWTTRLFDESIKKVLNFTESEKAEIRAEVVANRLAKHAANTIIEVAQKEIVSEPKVQPILNVVTDPIISDKNSGSNITTGIIIVGGILTLAGVAYGIYKCVPKVKKLIKKYCV